MRLAQTGQRVIEPHAIIRSLGALRVGLLSMTDAVSGELQGLRAVLTIGGRSLVRHQLGLALALGCTRIVVVTDALTSEVIALQHATESAGARFHVITSAHALLPLVTAEDDLIVLGDGLLVQPELALPQLEQATGVLALPVEAGTLIFWEPDGRAAQFCRACQERWFGFEAFDEPDDG